MPDSPAPCLSSLSVGSSSEQVLVDVVLCDLVEVVLVDGPCELVVDRICPPVVSPLLAPDWRGGTECLKKFHVRLVVLHRLRLSPWAYASLLLAGRSAYGFLSLLSLWTFLSLWRR